MGRRVDSGAGQVDRRLTIPFNEKELNGAGWSHYVRKPFRALGLRLFSRFDDGQPPRVVRRAYLRENGRACFGSTSEPVRGMPCMWKLGESLFRREFFLPL